METQELEHLERTLQHEARGLVAEAERITISDAEEAQAAADWLNEEITSRRKAVEAWFGPVVKELHTAHRMMTERRGQALAQFEEAERVVKLKLIRWKQEESDRRAALEAENGVNAVLIVPEPEPIAGVAFVQTWKAEVTDIGLLIEAAAKHRHLQPLLQINAKALTGMVRSLGGALEIPGVKVYRDGSVRRTG